MSGLSRSVAKFGSRSTVPLLQVAQINEGQFRIEDLFFLIDAPIHRRGGFFCYIRSIVGACSTSGCVDSARDRSL